MIISTHSPIILAASRQNADRTRWVLFKSHRVEFQENAADVSEEQINRIATLMGDANFDAYFSAAQARDLVFIEDTRPLTKQRLEEVWIPITGALNGLSELKKHIAVFVALPELVRGKAYFIIDNDRGKKEFQQFLTTKQRTASRDGFSSYSASERVQLILLPEGSAIEELFDEFDDVLEECIHSVFDDAWALRDDIPTSLSRAVSKLRSRPRPETMDDAKGLMKNEQDVKDIFWSKVEDSGYGLSEAKSQVLKDLLGLQQVPRIGQQVAD